MAAPASSPIGSLPIPRTRLIGREAERAAGQRLVLKDVVPLLTLTGASGVAKTRLAKSIAHEVAAHFEEHQGRH